VYQLNISHSNTLKTTSGQCTHNVALRSVRVTVVTVEKQYVLNIMHVFLS